MHKKKPVLFSDYGVEPPDDNKKAICIKNIVSSPKPIIREKNILYHLKTQLTYIGFWFWCGLVLLSFVFLSVFSIIYYNAEQGSEIYKLYSFLTILTSAGSLLAAISAPVLSRSYSHDMWELEESSLLNLPRLTSLRMIICAISSLPIMLCLILLTGQFFKEWFIIFCAFLIPFFTTNSINYLIMGKLRGTAGSICCVCACFIQCVLFGYSTVILEKASVVISYNTIKVSLGAILTICLLIYVATSKIFLKKQSVNYAPAYSLSKD